MKIPNYKILKNLGEGGMGTVYLAEHELIKRKVAIKVLHKHLVSNEDFITRFRREAELLAKLEHPNIVRLNEYFEHEGALFLIMEYVDGQELDQYINKVSGPIVEKELVPMFKQILSAMGYAHKKGLVHRDIKPANILISKEGTVKILDFGIAKLVSEDIGLTKSGVQVGTVTYMSPEQVNAEEVDKLTDIYSLGVTLYQMAVGQSPYKDTTSFKTQMKIVQDPFPKAKDIYPGVSDKIENIISKATQKKKENRYQNCEEFLQSLNNNEESSVNNNINEETNINKRHQNKHKNKKINVFKILSIMILTLVAFGVTYFIMYSDNQKTDQPINKINIVDTTNTESEKEVIEDNLYTKSTLKIGDYVEGGIVFYIDSIGKYALVCDIKDLGKAEFGCEKNTVTGANGTDIGTGQKNTRALCEAKLDPYLEEEWDYQNDIWIETKTISPYENRAKAAILCANSSAKGYDDWFLPSKDELNEIYLNKAIIDSISLSYGGDNFVSDYYWSSSEASKIGAWRLNFSTKDSHSSPSGTLGVRGKFYDFYVRAVRMVLLESKENKKKEKVDLDAQYKDIVENTEKENLKKEEPKPVVPEAINQGKVNVESISDLKYESSKYFNYSSDWYITSKGKSIIKKFLDSKNMSSESITRVLIVDNKYLVLLSGYKKPYCDIFTFDGIRVFSKELKGWPVSWSYCKKNMILCSDQWDDLRSRKNYINLKEKTLNTGFRKFKYFYGSCNLEAVNRYKWKS